jgi:hypothetical protein
VTYILRTHWGNQVDIREIDGPSLVVGRGGGAQLRFDDDTIDLAHARIDQIDGAYALSDNGSTAGTYVNGVKVLKKILSDGDRITIGPYLLIASIDSQSQKFALDIHTAAPSQPVGTAADSRDFDYAAAYALYRAFWNKTVLTLALVAASAALLLTPLKAGKHDLFQPAPVRSWHAIFAGQCGRCHQPWRGVSDDRCQECHGAAAAVHQKEQASIPTCSTCHVEHYDGESLSTVADAQCRRCHADLRTKSGRPPVFEKRVTNFSLDHPEFTVPVKKKQAGSRARMSDRGARQSDPTTIKLNHQIHLKANLKGPKGEVQLSCKDCHQPAPDGTIMVPITFAANCQECHPLEYDSSLAVRVVPHATPELVDAYLLKVYSNQVGKARAAEAKLFKSICSTCHELEPMDRGLPEIRPAAMPERWFLHGRFSHRSHRVLECNACHTRAAKSRRTGDVLVPGLQICQECHQKSQGSWLSPSSAAPTQCTTCHLYHERSANPDWDGPLNIRRLREPEPGKEAQGEHQTLSLQRYLRALIDAFQVTRHIY